MPNNNPKSGPGLPPCEGLRLPLPSGIHRALAVYADADPESAAIRAAHLLTVTRLTPYMMAANLLNGLLVLWAFGAQPTAGLYVWLLALVAVAVLGLAGWWRRRTQVPSRASPRAMRRAAQHAAGVALLWAAMPAFWFADASPPQQLLLATLITGLLGAGALALATLPLASAAYITILTCGALVALWRAGEPIYGVVAGLLVCYAATVLVAVLGIARQATALLRSQREAARQGHMVTLLLRDFEDHASEALWETRGDGTLVHVSPRLADLLGSTPELLRGRPMLQLLQQNHPDAARTLRQALDAGVVFRDLRLQVPLDGQARCWTVSGKRLVDEEGRPTGWRGVLADITAETQAQDRLRRLAHTDSLTGLANRLTLHEALRTALRSHDGGALLSLDLDHFKAINDSLGHSAGDTVLKTVAQRLRGCVRPGDVVARLGGDEFAVLCVSAGAADEATRLAARFLSELQAPIDLAGRRLRLGASVGVALWSSPAPTVDELLVHADLALYEAKDSGRGRQAIYTPQLGERSSRRTTIEQSLRQGLESGQFHLRWQAKVDIGQWRIVGTEALLRWHHPTLGRIGPSEFVGVAEQCGQIQALGAWVLHEACRAAAGPLAGLQVSVNVSPAQLMDGDFTEHVRQALLQTRIDPAQLELEITESLFMDDVGGALAQLQALHALGVRVALDDFGTGYSSLAYLRRFPFDTLKIDRAFINEMLQRDDAQAIVRMMTQLAGTLGMRTVAEGVETEAQLSAVAAAGCDEVQGFLVSRPCTLAELVELRRNWQQKAAPAPAALH
ncbi:MAG: EAL domain-containing protein [Rubrivivax sp.]|nr:EAL domain-containing protein [Rubrivivax sp.]